MDWTLPIQAPPNPSKCSDRIFFKIYCPSCFPATVYVADECKKEFSSSDILQSHVPKPQRSYRSQAIVILTLSVGSQAIYLALP